MKLKEFIERLSELDQSLDVNVFGRAPYDDYFTWNDPYFPETTGEWWSNIEVKADTVYIGG